VVDDEAAIREVTRRNLEVFGYRALTAKDGAEAVALYRAHRGEVRVVLTDLMMPGMDGRATIRALRELDPDVRVVAMSGLTPGGNAGPADVGARAFLPKPYQAADLLQTLRDVLGA
jgi:CheY-like chemotaxis protein